MTPQQYHEVLIGLDRVLFVFHESKAEMSGDDREVCRQIAMLRSQILKAESGHPFPFAQLAPEGDPEITVAPWPSAKSDPRQ